MEGQRTPRWRGVTLAHEIKAAGIPFALASDNSRDQVWDPPPSFMPSSLIPNFSLEQSSMEDSWLNSELIRLQSPCFLH